MRNSTSSLFKKDSSSTSDRLALRRGCSKEYYVQQRLGAAVDWKREMLLECDAGCPLFLGDAEEFVDVIREWRGRGDQRGLSYVSVLIGNVEDFSNGAVGEGEPEGWEA